MPIEEAPAAGRDRGDLSRLRAFLLFGLPSLLILAWMIWPLIAGTETLILRDVFQVHVGMKASLSRAFHDGYMPLIDLARSGGQPLAGNPNAVPFYPDNLLFLVAPFFWAFNAHFWLHLLIAPLAAYWMARAWGLPRPASWAVAVCYSTSGFMFSQLNLYNLIAGAALMPALVAATLRSGEGKRWAVPVVGLLWALLLVSGDPLTAVLGGMLALTAFLVRHGVRPQGRTIVLLGLVVALGVLVALPQLVEFLRILPTSTRGHQGFGDWRLTVGALKPVHAVEWLMPLAFGRYDLWGEGGLWGASLFDGNLPIYLSLYPGLLSLALVASAGLPRSRRAWWAWGMVATGVFFALGSHNPLVGLLFQLPGGNVFRYPVKVWPMVAIGASLLCGIGFQRTIGRAIGGERAAGGELGDGASVRLRVPLLVLGGLGVVLVAIGAVLVFSPRWFEALVLTCAPPTWPPEFAVTELHRWLVTLTASVGVVVGLAAGFMLCRTRLLAGASFLLALQASAQLFFLGSLAVTDQVRLFEAPPPTLDAVERDAPVVNAQFLHLFDKSSPLVMPDNRPQWPIRQLYLDLTPSAGVLYGLRYELDRSPEGLGSFLSRVAGKLIEGAPDDATRLLALSRWGVATVISEEPLEGVPPDLGELVGTFAGPATPTRVYRLPKAAPPVLLAEKVLTVPELTAARKLFLDPRFDPERFVILPGSEDAPPSTFPDDSGPEDSAPPPGPRSPVDGRVRVLEEGPESLDVAVDAPDGGVLVVQRAELPIWRAAIDGEAAAIEPANLYRIGVRVPAGSHRVRLWVDRRPLVVSSWAAAAGLLVLLGWLGWIGWRGRKASVRSLPGAPDQAGLARTR